MARRQKILKENEGDTNAHGRGKTIANTDEIRFLYSKLESHIPSGIRNNDGGYTKNSVQPLAKLYSEKIVDDVNKISANKTPLLWSITAETLANLINKGEATTNSATINELAGLALYLENIEKDILVCAKKILDKESWDEFRNYFKKEIEFRETFIFYNWTENGPRIAQMHFTLNEEQTEWTNCAVEYYDYKSETREYEKNTIKSEAIIINNTTGKSQNKALSFYVIHSWQVAQYNVPFPSDIRSRDFFLCSYSSFSGQDNPIAGIGILVKYDNVAQKIKEINSNKKIDDIIYNALYEKNSVLVYGFPDNRKLPNAAEVANIRGISGTWKAFSLRNTKPESATSYDSKGGAELDYLIIEPNGKISFLSDESGPQGYKGFLRYPLSDNKKLIKCNILASPKDKIYKIHLLLKVHEDKRVLEGVIAGWSNGGKPFASLLRLEKVSENIKDDADSLESFNPAFFTKNQMSSSPVLSDSLIQFFRNSNKYLDLPEYCLPMSTSTDRLLFKNIAGQYYLLGRDYEEGLINKAKLEIFNNGSFEASYPDVSYKGIVKEFVSIAGSDQYIYLDFLQKRPGVKKIWVNFAGGLLFSVDNILSSDMDKLWEKVQTLAGFSLRKNVNNLLQVKKEILIPAHSEAIFRTEIPVKYAYFQEKQLVTNLKKYRHNKSFSFDYRELIRGLRGRENNIMLLSLEQSTSDVLREIDYFEIYMNAFLFEVLFAEPIDDSKIYNYIIQALLHLDNPSKISTRLNYIFAKYKSSKITGQILAEIKTLFDDLTKQAKTGGLRHMGERLKPMTQKEIPFVTKINAIIQKIRKLKYPS